MVEKIKTWKLEQHVTGEGLMIPIYRDWDVVHENYSPKMVYVTTIAPGMEKGPILHRERMGFLTAISGIVDIETCDGNNIQTHTVRDDSGNIFVVLIPKNIPVKIINKSNNQVATIINLPNVSWHPENQDTIKFSTWEGYKSHVNQI